MNFDFRLPCHSSTLPQFTLLHRTAPSPFHSRFDCAIVVGDSQSDTQYLEGTVAKSLPPNPPSIQSPPLLIIPPFVGSTQSHDGGQIDKVRSVEESRRRPRADAQYRIAIVNSDKVSELVSNHIFSWVANQFISLPRSANQR